MKTILIIAGNDPSGGAGLLADVKTATLHGVFAMGVPTDLTIQNTTGVKNQHIIRQDVILEQLRCVLDDQIPDSVKIGLLPDADSIMAIAGIIKEYDLKNVVLDPVMFPTLGNDFIDDPKTWRNVMLEELIPLCKIITPNEDEAGKLLGHELRSDDDLMETGKKFLQLTGCPNVLITNYPQPGIAGKMNSTDILFSIHHKEPKCEVFSSPIIDTENTHGTGCALSTAIASNLALGQDIREAVLKSKNFVTKAIALAVNDSMGHGHGPLYLLPDR